MNKEEVFESAVTQNEAAISEFDGLVEYAVEVCLTNPDEYFRRFNERAKELEASKDQRPDLWKSRAELELQFNGAVHGFKVEGWPSCHDIVSDPEPYLPPSDHIVQAKIEAFGSAILDEAFLCLGEDAPEQAAKYASATTEKERNKVQIWLYNRIMEITILHEEREEERLKERIKVLAEVFGKEAEAFAAYFKTVDNEDITVEEVVEEVKNPELNEWIRAETNVPEIFHPARLSPKLIGVYPDSKLDPTCLSKSILVSSFFEKAGVPYLHAGVMQTAPEIGRLVQQLSVENILLYAYRNGIKLPDDVLMLIDGVASAYNQVVESQNSFHAAVVAKVAEKYWSLIDPNYDVLVGIEEEESEHLEDIHQKLGNIAVTQPGVEVALLQGSAYNLSVFSSGVSGVLRESQKPEELKPVLLDIAESDQPMQELKDYLLSRITGTHIGFDRMTHAEVYDFFVDALLGDRTNKSQAKIDYIDKILNDAITTYVFTDLETEGIEKCMNRLKSDNAYLVRRTEDIRMAPAYVTMRILSNVVNMLIRQPEVLKLPHLSMELGLPAYRIGACVLSDFDLYSGGNLPFSFWASNWASYVNFGNHTPAIEDVVQHEMASKLFQATDTDLLSYLSCGGIIRKSLEQKEH